MVVSRLRLRTNLLFLILLQLAGAAFSQTLAPGAPGKDAQWATAGKQGVGSSANVESKVWFTLAQGVMTEVYYPDVTVANVHLLQFVVVNPKTKKVETEQMDAIHEINAVKPDSLTFQQVNKAKSGEWEIRKLYVTDPKRNTVLISTYFLTKNKDLKLYLFFDPSIDNSGMQDTGWTENGILYASDKKNVSALIAGAGFGKTITNGFLGTSDGILQLKNTGKITNYQRVVDGNVSQLAEINLNLKFDGKESRWTNAQHFALGFGQSSEEAYKSAQDSLKEGYTNVWMNYEKGWADYIKTIRKVEPKYQAQFNMAAMQLKIHEDKTVRGANIASLSVPWGGGENANEANIGGYHLVWSRDLYQVATAFMVLGDKPAAERALDFLFKVQQKPDGSFPQNSYLDGRPFWGSLQHDEVAFPLILAYQLGKNDKATYENHVKRAADFIVRTGPRTPQERWEEEAGFSPSTIAAEIAGLVCAADIARKNGDEASAAIYLATADDWARKVEMWTATTSGKYGDGNYYLRITQNGKPDAGEKIELNNGAGFFDEREIVDAGFLELVRLGIKPANDPLIQKSLKVIDEVIRVRTPNGDGFYRYNHDGYGEMDDGRRWNWDGKYTGKGRLWALLSGERGQYELALEMENGKRKIENPKSQIPNPKLRLDAMLSFANEGLMIPEQVWDKPETPKNIDRQFVPELKFGEGTGSATPLAWSMAQFIRLAVNLQAGKNLDTPDIVYNRYKNGIPGQASGFGGMDESVVLPVNAGEKFTMTRRAAPNAKVALWFKGEKRLVPINEKGEFTIEIIAPESEELGIVAVEMSDAGASAFERVKVRAANTKKEGRGNFVFTPPRAGEASPKIFGRKGEKESDVMFVYRGAAQTVEIAGDFTGWQPRGYKFEDFGEYKVLILPFSNAARFEYKLITDGKWIEDPLNPNSLDNGIGGRNSFFAMPDYKPTNWDRSEDEREVFLNQTGFRTEVLNGERLISVYAPPECVKTACPALYLQDGSEYAQKARAVQVQQNLVKAGKTKPFIMVFLNPKDRMKEYWANDDYAKFVAEEVVPAIDKQYNTLKSRDGRAIMGASLGGITSIHAALKYPEIFGRIGAQSSSFWVDNERVVKALEKLDASKTRFTFYLDDGTLEGAEDTRRVNVLLRGKGFPVTYTEGETGHNWTSWRDRLADAFVALWK